MDSEQRKKFWTAWEGHCKMYQTSSKGKTPPDARNMLLTFAVAVREGKYGLRRQIKVQSVSKALRAVAQK